ncbi:MAG: Transcriptional regulator, AcrR family, partial [uncultured Solirubrobacteraceae bacterium]
DERGGRPHRAAGAQEAADPRGDHRRGAAALHRARVRAHHRGRHRGSRRHRAAHLLRLLPRQGGRGLPRLRGDVREPPATPRRARARRDRHRRHARLDRGPPRRGEVRRPARALPARARALHAGPVRAQPDAHGPLRDGARRGGRAGPRRGPGTPPAAHGGQRGDRRPLHARGLLRRQGRDVRRRRRPHGGRRRGADLPARWHRGAPRAAAGHAARARPL